MADKTVIDAMWDDAPIDVSSEVNFIWSIANKLRGPYQSDKYKGSSLFQVGKAKSRLAASK